MGASDTLIKIVKYAHLNIEVKFVFCALGCCRRTGGSFNQGSLLSLLKKDQCSEELFEDSEEPNSYTGK